MNMEQKRKRKKMKENREKSRVKQGAYVGKQILIAGSCSSVFGGARVSASTNGLSRPTAERRLLTPHRRCRPGCTRRSL
jgi:hypothetical protein